MRSGTAVFAAGFEGLLVEIQSAPPASDEAACPSDSSTAPGPALRYRVGATAA